ncbi:MAG: ribonuclease HII [Bradyrhizobiaceae bacterium]|nr:ribonuclease HII [Bradyrhizobiaceae bacterium]
MLPNFRREKRAYTSGLAPVAGCDEAGVAPLAGPVVAAAVILDPKRVPKGLDDSKRLTAERREELFTEICATAEIAVAFAPPARIDRDNIFRARMWALAQAVRALPLRPALVYVDGPHRPPLAEDFCAVETLVNGDALCASIAAASIVAKVTRDRLMCRLGETFPDYGFERHKGYGTELHIAALSRHGPTPHHRTSFQPVVASRAVEAVED